MSKPTVEKLRQALQRIHHVATTGSGAYMSIPADPRNDADLLLSAALDELEAYRARDREQLNVVRRAQGTELLDGPL